MAKPEIEKKESGAKPAKLKTGAKKRVKVSLRSKFGFFTAFLIFASMAVLGSLVYLQERDDLGVEVRERGLTVARNLASSMVEQIMAKKMDELTMSVIVKESTQSLAESAPSQAPAAAAPDPVKAMFERFKGLLLDTHKEVKNEGILEAVVVGTDGKIMAASVPSLTGSMYLPPDYVSQKSETEPFPTYLNPEKHRLYDISEDIVAKLAGNKVLGTVHLGLDREIIDRVIQGAAIKLAVIALGAVLFGLLVIFPLVTLMTRPIGRMVKGALAIAAGDFNQQIKVNTRDELGTLTRTFNEMAKSLKEKETLMGAFSRYVSSHVMEEVLSDTSKGGIQNRRMEATVYFSDVRGFTAMSETMRPEDVVTVINEYLGTQSTIINNAGGEVNKYVGDATMALFGLHEPKPDDPLKAVKAAWKIQKAIKKMNEQRTKRNLIAKQIGIGVNTGEIIVGNIGSPQKIEYTAMGDNVVLADKLCAICGGGEVLISESTYHRVKDNVEVKVLEPVALPGKKECIPVYQVVDIKG